MLIALVLGFVAGLAGTPHCLGICGGFPLYLSTESRGRTILRQAAFVVGKTSTYAMLGALASAAGTMIFAHPSLMHAGPRLNLVLGTAATVFGFLMLGLRAPGVAVSERIAGTGWVNTFVSRLMSIENPVAAGLLGLSVGFMPCPLPMGMLAVSLVMQNTLSGAALMAGLGLGSVPSLSALGMCSVRASGRISTPGLRAVGAVIFFTGLLILVSAWGNRSVP